MESLTDKVRVQESLAHISQAEVESVNMRDKALDRMEQELERCEKEGKANKIKPVSPDLERTVFPSKFVKESYLESKEEVDTFLKRLRDELTDALAKNERIEIR